MKAFFFLAAAPLLLCAEGLAAPSPPPAISSPWAELRKAPLFTSETITLAKIWGPALPVGTYFHVQKVYGRWVYGRAVPRLQMPSSMLAPPGWLFSRSLLLPGDTDTLTPELGRWMRALIFHSQNARKKLGPKMPEPDLFDLYESLTVSKRTLAAFSLPEQPASSAPVFTFLPEAQAEEEAGAGKGMGLTGADLSFLDNEFKVIQELKQKELYRVESKKFKIPPAPALDQSIRRGILGRYMLERYLEFPPVTMEEIDGFVYMRATALRALGGCSKEIQRFWKNRHWNFFRVYSLKARPEQRHPWLEVALPGGYFAISGRTIETAKSEAELAYLLVRQLVRELRVPRKTITFSSKGWPQSLQQKAEEHWHGLLRAQSTKESDTFDVSDEIAVDMQAVQCLANSGYQPMAALAYLKKMGANREQTWAEWFTKNTIGLDYRIERVLALIQDDLTKQKYPNSADAQLKRFGSATKQWNILP